MNDKLQVENGNFTRIVNEVLDEIVKIPLLGKEFAILFFIIRKTYGFQKTTDIISLSQIEKGTQTSRPTVVKAIKNLVARNMIVKTPLPDGRISFKFNKYHDNWVVKTPKLVKEKWVTSKDPLTKTSKDPLTHKRKKESNKRKIATASVATPFFFKDYLKELENHKARHVNVIGHYFEEKGITFDTREQANSAVKRHLRPAVEVSKFSDEEIIEATKEAKKQYKELWTVETILKVLTR